MQKVDKSIEVRIQVGQENFKNQQDILLKAQELTQFGEYLVVDSGRIEQYLKVHEFSSVTVTVRALASIGLPRILIGMKSVVPSREDEIGDGLVEYHFYDQHPFANHLGFTSLHLFFNGGEENSVEIPMEVYSSKATYRDAKNMLNFIQKNDPDIASLCFSQTRLDAGNQAGEKVDILRKIELGLRVVDYLAANIRFFKYDPCVSSEPVRNVVYYQPEKHHIDERSIEWLTRNTEQVELSIEEPHGHVGGMPVRINQVALYQKTDSTDVYENRVIFSFLQGFFQFLDKVAAQKVEQVYPHFSGEDIYSFEQLRADWESESTGPQAKIRKGKDKASKLKRALMKVIPCKVRTRQLPRFTNEVKTRRHYKELFSLIHQYYVVGEPDWSKETHLSGLKNLAKIYELYSLVHLLKVVKSLSPVKMASHYITSSGARDFKPSNEPNNLYEFRFENGKTAWLMYEPRIDRYDGSHGLFGLHKATRNIRDFGVGHLQPDFIMLSDERFVILDAKFSPLSNVHRYALYDITTRYGVGIHRHIDGKNKMAEGVVAIYPKDHRTHEPRGIDSLYENSGSPDALQWSGTLYLPPDYDGQLGAFDDIKDVTLSLMEQ